MSILKLLEEVKNLKREINKSHLYRRRIYTVKDASKAIGVSESYIQSLITSRKIAHSKPTGKLIFIRRRDLENFLMKNRISDRDEVDDYVINKILNVRNK